MGGEKNRISMSFSFKDPLTGSTWKDPFLIGSLTPDELSVLFNAGLGFNVTLPSEFEKYQYEDCVYRVSVELTSEGSLPPRLSAIDAKKSDWAGLFGAPSTSTLPQPQEEEVEEPKEPLLGLYSSFSLN